MTSTIIVSGHQPTGLDDGVETAAVETGDVGDGTPTIGSAAEMHDEVERRVELGPHQIGGQPSLAHHRHRHQTVERIVRAIGVTGRE